MCAVGGNSVITVDESLIVALLECPHYGFHKCGVHGLVCAVVIYPARHLLNVFLPCFVIAAYQLKALVVELVYTQSILDVVLVIDTEIFLDLVLDRQTMAVPAPYSGDLVALHCPVTGYHVLDERYQYGTVVRLSGWERRSVIEYDLGSFLVDRFFKYAFVFPEFQDIFLNFGNVGLSCQFFVLQIIHTPFLGGSCSI